jgi:hypothetical protein
MFQSVELRLCERPVASHLCVLSHIGRRKRHRLSPLFSLSHDLARLGSVEWKFEYELQTASQSSPSVSQRTGLRRVR